jgi:hypothetical protein
MSYIKFYGNEATNVGVANASKQQHAVYFTTDTNDVDVGWNDIHDNKSCRALQFHSSPLCSPSCGSGDTTGKDQYDLSVHDNLIYNDPCDAMNFATVDPSKGKVEAYNNVFYHDGIGPSPSDGDGDYSCFYSAGYTNTGTAGSGTIEIYNNTLYDCGSYAVSSYGAFVLANGSAPNLQARLRNNIVYQLSTEPFATGSAIPSAVSGSNNVWYGGNQAAPTWTTGNITSDPLFVNLSGKDFHLQSGSPAKDAAVTINSSNYYNNYTPWNGIPEDHDGISRPQGSAPDIGAYEYH